jgi:RNA polymerase sigma-70 factor (ECF subfamily)
VKNTSKDFLQKRNKDNIADVPDDFLETIPDENIDILGGLIVKEGCESVKEAVKRLSEPLKDVFVLSVFYERTHDEISQLLGITRDASKMRLHRAKQKIREFLRGEEHGK